ncbi:hypothetical protein SAMN03159341_112122 [Paenibacillus sp. 1_12]|uniref:hypothetical protein n=1 Tax=Paenibacillus sp. 1_12 TaxID=1566278 RepID=UPI0008EBFF34|nr:hypothetical protein [Paenibacillus sp. 1_12]SFL95004.1 hypothetical protein SAMN03159341_112122 [Paenibacillus sp. 1_12]
MNQKIEQALAAVIRNWKSMAASKSEEAESSADQFEASFYVWIETVRDWVYELEQRPQTLEEAMELPVMKEILEVLPEPLLLNFETEVELILEKTIRIDDEKYD